MEPHCLGKVIDREGTVVKIIGYFFKLYCGSLEPAVLGVIPPSPEFGKWNTVFKRYRDWVKVGVFETIFAVINDDVDMEYAMIGGTIIKAHGHGRGSIVRL